MLRPALTRVVTDRETKAMKLCSPKSGGPRIRAIATERMSVVSCGSSLLATCQVPPPIREEPVVSRAASRGAGGGAPLHCGLTPSDVPAWLRFYHAWRRALVRSPAGRAPTRGQAQAAGPGSARTACNLGAVTDRPAVLSGTPVRAGKSWPRWPYWDDAERRVLEDVLESGSWSSTRGDQVTSWAAELAAFQDCRHGLAVTNGTHTIEAAFAACEVGEGDEVIVPALTFVATATAALAVNATPVLVDVDAGSLCIDVAAAEAAITDRTRAIAAVHIAGTACDLDSLVDLCDRHGLALVEDCAHAHGTRWRGLGVGSFGSFGSFSFEASKLMTAGEGGVLITNDDTL